MKKLILLAAVIGTTNVSHAQELQIATGNLKTGTYAAIINEYNKYCGGIFRQVETNGSVTNVDLLVKNKVNAAVVQADVLFFRAQNEPNVKDNVKTLFNLYPEEVHLIARGDVKKEGGFMGFGGKEVKFDRPESLAGRNVGAVGGSVITARILAGQSGIAFNVVEYPNNDALKTALLEGKVDGIVVVGGAPHALVESLDRQYKLLPFSADLQKKVSGVYSPSKVTYSNLDQRGLPAAVPTIATEASVVTRVYKSDGMNQKLSEARGCFEKKLADIQDTTGTHAKWQDVKLENKGKWPAYQFTTGK